jgi:hypothetical protein
LITAVALQWASVGSVLRAAARTMDAASSGLA